MRKNELLGDYELLEMLGKGGQGVVYKARDTKLHRLVAVKIFAANDECRRQKLASFKHEARLVSALSHPNICSVYSLLEDDGQNYFVMEYVDGKNLYEVAYRRPLEIKSALRIILQVTDALIAAHARGIIHRDIKPRNVMITETGRVVLLDFGLAKFIRSEEESVVAEFCASSRNENKIAGDDKDFAEDLFLTKEGVPYGSATSSPPEMALGKQTDQRGDIFSTGVLLYLLLTGTYPFLAKTVKDVRHKIINEEPVPLSVARRVEDSIPLSLIAAVRKALRKKPEERYQSAAELRDSLLSVLKEIETADEEKAAGVPSASTSVGAPRYARLRPEGVWQRVGSFFKLGIV